MSFTLAQIKSVCDTVLCISELNRSQAEGEIYNALEWEIVAIFRNQDGVTISKPCYCEAGLIEAVSSKDFDGVVSTLYAHLASGGVAPLHDFTSRYECETACHTLTNILCKN